MNDVLEISTLGGLEIRLGGQAVTGFDSRKVEALLVYLGCTGRSHSRDVLADLLWDELPQKRAMANLRVVLHSLRQQLEPYVDITRTTVGMKPQSDPSTDSGRGYWVDAVQLEKDLAAARASRGLVSPTAAHQIEGALSLCNGDFMQGFYLRDCPRFEEWQRVEQERLRGLAIQALHDLVAYHLEHRQYEAMLLHARRLLELDPFIEAAHRQVMLALAYSGQRGAALAAYETCRTMLEQELEVEPELETTRLHEQILAGEVAAPPAHNLPAQRTPFVGREGELAALGRLLADPDVRLVTVVGAGGSGKTRLALEAAAAHLERFEHGLFFVPLAPLRSADGIVPALADALGFTFPEGREPRQQLLDYLQRKQLLLLMDNYEHLLDDVHSDNRGGVGLVSDLLANAPQVKILATSRARLNVEGEQLFPLAGMEYPVWVPPELPLASLSKEATQYSAVELLLQSARRVRPGFHLRHDDVTHLIHICRLVEGMPLGILLAANWVRMLTPAEIASELSQSLDFLQSELRDAPPRQRSMRAVFDHSWRLLTAREREILPGLSVFRGGFSREAARAVTGASLRELMGLLDKSLLGHNAAGTYAVHELVRQFAEEKLDQVPGVTEKARDRHCAHYAVALERWALDLKGARAETALAEMDAEIENARAAWDWAVERGQVEQLDKALDGLCRFFDWRGRVQEGEAACRSAVERLRPIPSSEALMVSARALAWQGTFSYMLGQVGAANHLLEQSLDLLACKELTERDTRLDRAFALAQRGLAIQRAERDYQRARRLYQESLTLYEELNDRHGMATVQWYLGRAAHRLGAMDEAKQLFEESLAIRQSLGDRRGIAMSLEFLGIVAVCQGRLEKGEQFLRRCIAVSQEIGYREYVADGLSNLGWILYLRGEFSASLSPLKEAMTIHDDLGLRDKLAYSTGVLALAEMHLGRYEQARARTEAVLKLARDEAGKSLFAVPLSALVGAAMAEEKYFEAYQLLNELDDVSWLFAPFFATPALFYSIYTARGLGELSQTWAKLQEALQTAIETGFILAQVDAQAATAVLMAAEGRAERAVELYALASRHPYVANSQWLEDVAGKHINAVASTLPHDVLAAAQERGRVLDWWETAEESLDELRELGWPTDQV